MKIAQDLSMGLVDLVVRDLDRAVAFYSDGVGLDVLSHGGGSAILGRRAILGRKAATADVRATDQRLMQLTQNRDLPQFNRRDAGLFHTAILFASQEDLAQSVLSVVRHAPRNFTGASDHLVSEAFYFDDPEGNGVELYVDRPRDQWRYNPDGTVDMATLALDPNAFLTQFLPEDGSGSARDAAATVGHVHLQVGDIPRAEQFYSDVLGFDVMNRYGSQAMFVAAGGYHHHIGMNTWNSAGAGPRAASLGLGQLSIQLPTLDDVAAIHARVREEGVAAEHDGDTLRLRDPWGTLIEINA